MVQRILSTVTLWLVVGGSLWFFRTNGALVLIALISLFTLREFYQLMRAIGYTPFDKLGLFFGTLITLAPWVEAQFHRPAHPLLALATVVFAVRLLGERTPENRVESLCSTIFGLVYISLLMQYLTRIITPLPADTISANGRLLLCLWVVVVAKFCDMGALLTGLAIGKHKMSPLISPKKTWEGAVGGVIFSMITGATIAHFARDVFPAHMTPVVAALIAAPIAVLGIVADLVESVIKRRANAKDSGATIPGIGGMFDLSDSILLAAPVGYFLFGLP
ncbi:MAG: phosphatidate cytidylyltransferase [Verrucomicrobia bacterium]|nr:phosphatidate cytidylyltransferase [Verrucomicrobiota bacterium]